MPTFSAEIPASVAAASAPGAGRPLLWSDPDGEVACAYRRVTDELVAQLEVVPA